MDNSLFFFIWLLCGTLSVCQEDYEFTGNFNDSEIEDIRLLGGNYGDYAGRVEVKYNGTWGTVCDSVWGFGSARVACRMLGFSEAACSVRRGRFGSADLEVPIWMDNVQCGGLEETLDQCVFSGWGENSCDHRDDAGVICINQNLFPAPEIKLLNSTRRAIFIEFNSVLHPPEVTGVLYRIRYRASNSRFYRFRFLRVGLDNNATSFTYQLTSLTPDTDYTIQVRLEVQYEECRGFNGADYSEGITVQTNDSLPMSTIPVRLVPPEAGLNFLGRVEVQYQNRWGTVCDDRFGFDEARVVCEMLGFQGRSCFAGRGRFGRGTGPIWIDDLDCSTSDILDDCTFRPWGQTNCNHGDDVGVICTPGDYPGQVQNLTVTKVTSSSISLSWEPFAFPLTAITKRYVVTYATENNLFRRQLFVVGRTTATLSRVQFRTRYNITVRADVRFSPCFLTLSGVESESVIATPMESPPDGPPTSFHVAVQSCSSIRAEWGLPSFTNRNGIIRGFKVFVQPSAGGEEQVYEIMGNETSEVIINNLAADTEYIISVLAYTVGDGPRSIHLTVRTNTENICHTDLINFFGLNGNGAEKATQFTHQRDIHIFCGSSVPGVQLDWFFSNGTKVGISNRNVREGHFPNGTASLQIASDRRLSPCDSGVYSCRANLSSTGQVQQKTFTLVVNSGPPAPTRPRLVEVTSQTITISWEENRCTGGHNLDSFTIRYYTSSSFPFDFFRRFRYITGIDEDVRQYIITDLNPSTTYSINVAAIGMDSAFGSYSVERTVTTLPPAPPSPVNVIVTLVSPLTLNITWGKPQLSAGNVVFYTVYAIPLLTETAPARNRRQAETLDTLTKKFSSADTSGTMTLHDQSITYHVQVSATIRSQAGDLRESSLSPITPRSTIFVPLPDLPVPEQVRVESTSNASITLTWNDPLLHPEEITNFKVFYSAEVSGVSPNSTLLRFTHEGSTTTSTNSINLKPLTPQSDYIIKVSAVTSRGQGEEVTIAATTDAVESQYERYVYFHIRFGPVVSCVDFRSNDVERKRNLVKEQLVTALQSMCNCDISTDHIQNDVLGCGGHNQLITYRGRLLGGTDYSALGLMELMQTWIDSRQAAMVINSFRMQLDPSCPARLDSINAAECPLGSNGPPGVVISTSETKPTDARKPTEPVVVVKNSARAGEIGGITIGALVLIVLSVLVVLIVVIALFKGKHHIKINTPKNGSKKFTNEDDDHSPFKDMEPSALESSLYDEKMKEM